VKLKATQRPILWEFVAQLHITDNFTLKDLYNFELILENGVILSPQKRIPNRTALIAKENADEEWGAGQVHALSQAGGGSAFEVWPRH
jgi:hypothetical protein